MKFNTFFYRFLPLSLFLLIIFPNFLGGITYEIDAYIFSLQEPVDFIFTVLAAILGITFVNNNASNKKSDIQAIGGYVGIILAIIGNAINSSFNYIHNYYIIENQELYNAIYYIDEIVGHYLAAIGLLFFLLYTIQISLNEEKDYIVIIIGNSILLGFSLFGLAVEGQVSIVTILFGICIIGYGFFTKGLHRILHDPIIVGCIIALVGIVAWFLYFGSFIEPSELIAY
jgi:hypothetical protein